MRLRVVSNSSTKILSASRGQQLTMPGNFAPFEAKMRADGLSDAAVAAFKNAYDALTSGACGALQIYRGRLL